MLLLASGLTFTISIVPDFTSFLIVSKSERLRRGMAFKKILADGPEGLLCVLGACTFSPPLAVSSESDKRALRHTNLVP